MGRDDSPISGPPPPPDIFRGLFICHRRYRKVCEASEIACVSICVRSTYKMPGLYLQRFVAFSISS